MDELLASAALAEAHHDYRAAVAHYEEALAAASGVLRRELHLRRLAAIRSGELADAELRAEAAMDAAAGDLDSEIEIRLELARIAHVRHAFADAIVWAMEAQSRAARAEDAEEVRAHAHHIVGRARLGLGQPVAALAELEAAARLYHELEEEERRAEALQDRARALAAHPPSPQIELPPLVGRARECAVFVEALATAAGSQGSSWLMSGEAGIGKTRLCEEVDRLARLQGFSTLWGRCWENEGPAYGPWIEILQQLAAGEALRSLSGELSVREFQIAEAVLASLRAASAARPLVLFLEDVHLADLPSLRLAQWVARELRWAPVVLVCSYRGVEARHDEAVRRELAALARNAKTLTLTGLSEEEVAALVGPSLPLGLIALVHQRSEGNPLFARELSLEIAARLQRGMLASSTTDLPLAPAVSEAIVGRLQLVSPAARKVLEAAAIAGRTFAIPLVAKLCGWQESGCLAAMEEGLRAGLVAVGSAPEQFRFVDSLVRAKLYQGLPAERRVEMHRAFAEAAEAQYAAQPEPRYAELARHFEKGALPKKAARYHRLAGERAAAQASLVDAAKHLRAALEMMQEAGERCVTLVALGGVEMSMGQVDLAAQTFARAAELARPLGAEMLARVALGLGRTRPSVALCAEALAALGDDAPALRARLHARISAELMFSGRDEERELHGRWALAMARAVADPGLLIGTLYSGFYSLWTAENLAERVALAAEMEGATALAKRPLEACHARLLSLFELDDLAAVDVELDRLGRLARELRDPHYEWLAGVHGAALALLRGRLDEAEWLALGALSLGDRIEWRDEAEMAWLLLQWRLRKEQGRLDELRERAEEALAQASRLVDARYLVASVRLACGDVAGARSLYDGLLVRDIPRDLRWLGSLVALSELALAFGDKSTLREIYNALLPFEARNAIQGPGAISYGPVALTLGQIAAALDRREEARQHLERALERGQRTQSTLVMAQAGSSLADVEPRRLARDAFTTMGLPARAAALEPLIGGAPALIPLSLVRQDNLWRLSYGEKTLWVRDMKGMGYLAELVRQAGREIHVADLTGAVAGEVLPDEGDAGEMLDARARSQYRARLTQLEGSADESARAEIDFLRAELSRAVGLGGRSRRAADRNERLRQSVTKRLREAIRKISEQDAAVGGRLGRAITTGIFCSYSPVGQPP